MRQKELSELCEFNQQQCVKFMGVKGYLKEQEKLDLLAGTGTTDYIATMQLGKLADELTDCSRSRRDENCFPLLWRAHLVKSSVCCESWHP